MRKLPIGIQSFVSMRTENYYYVDKTPFVKRLADEGKYYFLSRPRRFGKSLFLDTLRQAFLGKKDLFEGLYLEKNWDWERRYPVIYISFGSGVIRNIEELILTEKEILRKHIRRYDLGNIEAETIKGQFGEIIERLSEKFNTGVVILIDEYDKPILDNIENKEIAREIREELKNFYSVIKDADEYVKFCFITGVSKFSKVSLFSGLNNLRDITIDEAYATICGYTQEEFEKTFADRLKGVDLEGIKRWYNGYHFLGKAVYNPFDILLYLQNKIFRPYWFETGTPTFLIKLLEEKRYFIPKLEQITAGEELLNSFDVDQIYVETLLFQTGYLTIKERIQKGSIIKYRLTYPNLEVKYSLTNYILNYFVQDIQTKETNRDKVYDLLEANAIDELKEVFHAFFASIPHDWYRKNELSGYEGYYASIFYCYFTALGLDVRAEDVTNHGQIDMTVVFADRAYIFEFKVVELTPEGKALKQLKKKRYHEKYMNKAKEIYLIGVEFSKKTRNIVGYEVERVV